MCNYIITDEEIEKAEKDIFKNGEHFNEEQKTVLKCLDSCCVQAYAGTGKTSTIVGKLHVLAQKNVWQNGRGICVISHTNVAVDEIKKHVAIHYPAIMQYPNFVGTIQEFVNKFLFIPYLAGQGLKIRFQDEFRYYDINNLERDLKERINNYISGKINHSKDREKAKKVFFEKLHSVYFDSDKLYCAKAKNSKIPEFTDLETKEFPQVLIIAQFKQLIEKLHKEGRFLFIESLICSLRFLKERPFLKSALSQRFQFVFLDEAQDCSEIQLSILRELFDGDDLKTVSQQIGDINQAISETKWSHGENYLALSQSARFGNNLAEFINKFQVRDNKDGVLGATTRDTKKYLITYNPREKVSVLKKFAEILKTEKIPTDKDFFAISSQHKQLTKYFPDYSKKLAKNKNKKTSYRFDQDIDYVNLLTKKIILQQGSNFVARILLNLLYKHFKISGNSWSELKDYLRANGKVEDFKKLVLEMSISILQNDSISNLGSLKNKLNIILGENKIDFANGSSSYGSAPIQNLKENKFSYDGIDINIGTIHSVKGQTHNATLCFSNKEDGKQDIQHTLDNTGVYTPKYKKLLYVASSRAKHLFVFAIEQSAYKALTDKTMFQDFIVEAL